MTIFGNDKYGLSKNEIYNLDDKLLTVEVYVKPVVYDPRLYRLPHDKRIELKNKLADAIWRRAYRYWPDVAKKEFGSKGKVYGFTSVIKAKELSGIPVGRLFQEIRILNIEGMRPIRHIKPKVLWWFAVRGLVAIQIEGQTKGYQDVEERILIVKAYSKNDAVKKLKRNWERYEEPYMNKNGYLVRWKLEEIIDVYETCDRKINPAGTEVYSTMRSRRLKPQYEWHPFDV